MILRHTPFGNRSSFCEFTLASVLATSYFKNNSSKSLDYMFFNGLFSFLIDFSKKVGADRFSGLLVTGKSVLFSDLVDGPTKKRRNSFECHFN